MGIEVFNVNILPHFLDYELVTYEVNFRNINEGTREDTTAILNLNCRSC